MPDDPRRDDTPADRRRRERLARQLAAQAPPPVVAVLAGLPRHAFVPADCADRAYDDACLPIWGGQTISQPSLIAAMLTALDLRPGARVLDLGAGCGYAAAAIARLVGPTGRVLAVERLAVLAHRARTALAEHAPMVEVRHGDGTAPAADWGRFDAVHAACALAEIPAALLALVEPGGRVVAPIGRPDRDQRLHVLRRSARGWRRTLGPRVRFVPGLPGLG